ncbi:actin cytoskeleton protein [Mucor ambiguus]|uniref:Actin cytoskeleton protein n=1 Tax=Mucor ambiguus TaxID=91626 RepID=A0A0C9MKH3_9FUNG|nr:actin cytoskeleton protein [Mucor ambiguus]
MDNQWSINIPAEPTSQLVLVKNISLETQEATIKDFFSFCGIITAFEMKRDIHDEKHHIALIMFEKDSAAKTATLLSQAVVDDSPIEVEPYFKQVPAAENITTPVSRDAQQKQQQQPQESKSVSHVMAELLASGYVLTESVVNKGAEFDEKHGVSTRVNGYLNKMGLSMTQLNQKFHSSSNLKDKSAPVAAVPADSTANGSDTPTTTTTASPAPSRMQNLMNSRASLKVQGFASRMAGKVSTVHEEAKRIAAEKKKDAAATATSTTPSTTVTPGNDAVDHKSDQQELQQHQHVEGASHSK